MGWNLTAGAIFRVPVQVHMTVPLCVLVAALFLKGGVEPELTDSRVLLWVFAWLTATFLHEVAHALMARRLGAIVDTIVVLPFGGITLYERAPTAGRAEICVALAGPAANGVIGLLCWLIHLAGGHGYWQDALAIHLIFGGLNAAPIFPMDGGKALHAFWRSRVGLERATARIAWLGRGVGLCTLGAAFHQSELALGVLGLFIVLVAGAETERILTRAALASCTVRDVMEPSPPPIAAGQPVSDAVGAVMHEPGIRAWPVAYGAKVIGVIHRDTLLETLAMGRAPQTLTEVIDRAALALDADTPLQEALERMRSQQARTAVALRHGDVIGILFADKLAESLRRYRRAADVSAAPAEGLDTDG